MAILGSNAYIAVTVSGKTYVVSDDNGLTDPTFNPDGHALRRRPGGGSQGKKERDKKQNASLEFSVDLTESMAELTLEHIGKSGAWTVGIEGNTAGKPQFTFSGLIEAEITVAEDDFNTASVTVYPNTMVSPSTF